MKKLFTKIYQVVTVIILFVGAALQANAQYTLHTKTTDLWVSAVTSDANGDVFVVEAITEAGFSDYGQVIEYAANGTSGTIYNGSTHLIPLTNCDGGQDAGAQGIAVTANGDVYVTTANDPGGSCTPWGNIIKIPCTTLNTTGVNIYGAPGAFLNGNSNIGLFSTLAVDSGNNLYCYLYDVSGNSGKATINGLNGSYEVEKFPANTSGVPQTSTMTRIAGVDALKLNVTGWNASDIYNTPTGLAVDPSGNVYVADSFDEQGGTDGGKVYKITPAGSASLFTSGQYTSALGTDGSGNLYAINAPGDASGNHLLLVQYKGASTQTNSTGTTNNTLYSTFGDGGPLLWWPNTIAAINSANIYVDNGSTGGSNNGDLDQVTGPTINSITATDAYTKASSETFTVTFSVAITGVSASNFSLSTSGVSGASIGTPTTSNNITWSVPVNTGSGDGTLGLNLANSTGMQYGLSTTLPFTGGTTIVDKTAPTIFISAPSQSSIIDGAGSVTYTVTYNDVNFASSSLGLPNITLNKGGVSANGTVGLSGSGTSYTVTISSITGSGTLGISIAAGTALDKAGNSAAASAASTTFNVLTPTIISPSPTVTLPTTMSGTPGSSASFSFAATNLNPATGSITVTAPTNVQVSPDGSTWYSSSYTQSYSGSNLGPTPVYVRLSGTGTVGTISGNVSLSGGGAATVTQAVSGTLNTPAVATTTSLSSNNNPSFTAAPNNSVTFTATVTHSGTPVTESTVSFTSNGVAISGGSNVALNGSGQAAVTTSFSSTGSYTILATFNADANFLTSTSSSLPQQVNVHSPAIASTGTPSALSTTVGAASPSTSFNVSGAFMPGGILVSPPTGFEVSTDNSTFTSTVTVGASGTIASTPVYIRLAASDAVGTYSGNIVLSSPGATNVNVATLNSGVFTPPGNALSFDGVDDGVTMGTPPATVSGNFTVEAWVLPTDGTKDMHVFSTRSTGEESFDIQITGGNSIHGDIGTGSAWLTTAADAAFSYHAGQWIHIAYVVTTTGYSIYANGNLAGSGTFSGTPLLLDNTHVTTIGFDPGEATYFNGSIDEVRVYKAALSQANIQADMLSTASSSPLNLVNYYNFDNGAAGGTNTGVTTLTDKTATAYNGTLSNFALSGATSNWVESYAMVVPAATAASGVSTNGFTANWTAPITGTVTNYFVDVSTSSAFTSVISGSPFSTTSTSQAISGLTAGTYYYRVRANKTSVTGEGDYSAIITATVPVAISSLSIAGSSPTNAASVNYTATFGSAITGLTAGNFLITASGVTGALIGTPTTGDGGITWTVPVSTGTGDGTIQLILENATGISPAISTSLPFPGQTYTIDKTAPTVLSLSRADPNPTNETQLDYQITFSEPVTGVDNTDFTAVTSGVSAGAISVTPQSSTVYNISIASVNGTGTLQLNLNNSGTGIIDVAGNGISGGFSGDTYNVDQTAPFVSSITATTPGNTNPTNATSVTYTVTFSEPVTGVSNLGFMATTTNTVASSSITVTPVSSSVYTATVNGISGDGTLGLDLNNGNTGIFDLAGNPLSGGFTGDVYNIDNTAPGVVFANYGSNNSNSISWAKVGDVIALDAQYNETVQTPVVTIGGHSVTPVFGLNTWASVYTLTPADIEGPIAFDIQATDLAGNTTETSSTSTGKFITFDMTPPTAMISAPSVATIGTGGAGTVTYTVTYADANFNTSNLTGAGITLSSPGTATGTVAVTGSGTSYTVTISNITGLGTLSISVGAGYASDLAGNTDLGAGPSASFNVVSTDATLSNLTLDNGTLTPGFSPGTVSYTASVRYVVSSINITPTVNQANATLTVNSSPATSGTAFGPIALTAGAQTVISVAVTAPDGSTTKTYKLTVTRALSRNANLGAIGSSVLKTPAFSSGTTSYTASVGNEVASMTIKPVTSDANATLKVNGTPTTSGTVFGPIALTAGAQTVISIAVTSSDGSITKTYKLTVTRAPSSDDNLVSIGPSAPLTPGFSSGNTDYTLSVSNATASTTVKPVTSDANATLKVNGTPTTSGTVFGPIALTAGAQTVISIAVMAQDGSTNKTYTLKVTRALSGNANLSSIGSSILKTPTFLSGTTSYTTSVGNDIASMTVKPVTIDPNATIKVNGTPTTSGTVFGPIALTAGAQTVISIAVTSQDGSTTKTYTLTVTRPLSSNANLGSIGSNAGGLTPAFSSAITSYTLSVSNAIESMTVKPVTSDANATVKVNGTATTPGTVFGPIALTAGAQTVISIAVMAQDGTINTYTLTVTRAPGGADSYGTGISVTKPTETPVLAEDGILVHQGISPNGDGINDFLQIDNISQYPDNKLAIMNRNGQLVYEAKGYDNSSKTFDGHSNKNGQMQLPGTYFYQLDYTVGGIIKHKTGFLVLKY